MKIILSITTIGLGVLAGCSMFTREGGMGMMNGMNGMDGMMARHAARIPEEYAGLRNPTPADDASLGRGEELFTTYCVPCHGAGGMGDGPAGAELDPAPAPIAHTSRMLGDDYLFWRISEGGVPFASSMPMFKAVFDEEQRWDLINYIRALGSGRVQPGDSSGGEVFDPQSEIEQRESMLEQAVAEGVVTQEEADTFLRVHKILDEKLAAGELETGAGNAEDVQAAWLAALVEAGEITQGEADGFLDVHARLVEAGLMQ